MNSWVTYDTMALVTRYCHDVLGYSWHHGIGNTLHSWSLGLHITTWHW